MKKDQPPDFVLRAKDVLAPGAIAHWIENAMRANSVHVATELLPVPIPFAKLAGAARHLAEILDYQEAHGAKLPD